MNRFVNWLKIIVSPKGRLSRRGFIVVFLCAIVSIKVFALIAYLLWLHYNQYSEWSFNVNLLFCKLFGWIGLIFGFIPLAVYALSACVIDSFKWGYEVGGYSFFVESLIVVAAYIIYMIQCIRRCHDLGRKWWFCLIPFYNPFVLLFGKTNKEWKDSTLLWNCLFFLILFV